MKLVSILGHVDHGKTTLCSNLISETITEQNLITVFVRSYIKDDICFVDNPGHEDFQSLQKYIIKYSDICILVVDSTKGPQDTTLKIIEELNSMKKDFIFVFTKYKKKDAFEAENASMKLISQANYLGSFYFDKDDLKMEESIKNIFNALNEKEYSSSKFMHLESVDKNKYLKVFKRNTDILTLTLNGRPDTSNSNISYIKMPNKLTLQNLLEYYEYSINKKTTLDKIYWTFKINLVISSKNITEALNIFQYINKKLSKIKYIYTEFVFYTDSLTERDFFIYKHCYFISNKQHLNKKVFIFSKIEELDQIIFEILTQQTSCKCEVVEIFKRNSDTIYGLKLLKGEIKLNFNFLNFDENIQVKDLMIKNKKEESIQKTGTLFGCLLNISYNLISKGQIIYFFKFLND